jgi:hypothetical protein
MRKPPNKIYLQIGEDVEEFPDRLTAMEHATWASDKICDTDIEYQLTTPPFETPEEFQKREGKDWPDNAYCWYRAFTIDKRWSGWSYATYSTAKRSKRNCKRYGTDQQILISHNQTPPPNDWGEE